MPTRKLIRRCEPRDFHAIWEIVNDGARAYQGIIPADRLRDPYMSKEELQHELDEGVATPGPESRPHYRRRNSHGPSEAPRDNVVLFTRFQRALPGCRIPDAVYSQPERTQSLCF